jgi:hypothetical protein
MRDLAALAFGDQASQCELKIGARRAAQAAVAEQDRLLAAGAHQLVVDADRAELVDDDGRAASLGRGEEAFEQGGLAGAEEAGEDRDRYAARARAPLLPAERPGGARGEEVETQKSISRI